jgi:hypothetical protein
LAERVPAQPFAFAGGVDDLDDLAVGVVAVSRDVAQRIGFGDAVAALIVASVCGHVVLSWPFFLKLPSNWNFLWIPRSFINAFSNALMFVLRIKLAEVRGQDLSHGPKAYAVRGVGSLLPIGGAAVVTG